MGERECYAGDVSEICDRGNVMQRDMTRKFFLYMQYADLKNTAYMDFEKIYGRVII